MHNACSNYTKTKKATSCTKKCNVFAHIFVYKGYGSYSGYRKYDDIQIRFCYLHMLNSYSTPHLVPKSLWRHIAMATWMFQRWFCSLTCACECEGLLSPGLPSFLAGRSAVLGFCPDAFPGMQSGNCMKKSSPLPDKLSSCSISTRDGCSGLESSFLLGAALLWVPQDGGLDRGAFSWPANMAATTLLHKVSISLCC